MAPSLDENDDSNNRMDVNVMIQRQDLAQATRPQRCDGVSQYHKQNHHRIEQQSSSKSSGENVKPITSSLGIKICTV